jgi:hypothetical protein
MEVNENYQVLLPNGHEALSCSSPRLTINVSRLGDYHLELDHRPPAIDYNH